MPEIVAVLPSSHHVSFDGWLIDTKSPEPLPLGGGFTTPVSSNGVQGWSRAKSMAQDASINPKPHFSCHLSEIVFAGLSLISDEFLMTSITSKASKEGAASLTNATMPEAIGVAILVPSFSS